MLLNFLVLRDHTCFDIYRSRRNLVVVACPDGSFGEGCVHSCRCINNETCDKVLGNCSNGCDYARSGFNCSTGKTIMYNYMYYMAGQLVEVIIAGLELKWKYLKVDPFPMSTISCFAFNIHVKNGVVKWPTNRTHTHTHTHLHTYVNLLLQMCYGMAGP